MKCDNCGKSVLIERQERINSIGEIGIFWCMSCIKKNEPELYKNIIEDRTELDNILEEICYDTNPI